MDQPQPDNIADQQLTRLYEQHKEAIYGFLLKLCRDPDRAQDLTQETFLKIVRFKSTFSPEKGTFRAWAFTIARNNFYKSAKKDRYLTESANLEDNIYADGDHTAELEGGMMSRAILAIIDTLPDPEKSILKIKQIQGNTLQQTSVLLNLSQSTVSRKLLNAYQLLRQELARQNIAYAPVKNAK